MRRNEDGTREERELLLSERTSVTPNTTSRELTNFATGDANANPDEESGLALPTQTQNRRSRISECLILCSTIFYLLGQISIAVLIGFYYTARAKTGFQRGLDEINGTWDFHWTAEAVKKFVGAICAARTTGPNLAFGKNFPTPDSHPDSFSASDSYPTLSDVVTSGLYILSPFSPLLGSMITVDVFCIWLFLKCVQEAARSFSHKLLMLSLVTFLCKLIPSILFLALDLGQSYGACQALKLICDANNFDNPNEPLVTIDSSTNPYHALLLTMDIAADNANAIIIAAFLFHTFISFTHILISGKCSSRQAPIANREATDSNRAVLQQAIANNAQRVRNNLHTETPLTHKDKLEALLKWNPNFLRELPNDFLNQLPFLFTCPVSLEFFTNPVTTSDGSSYDRAVLESIIQGNQRNPLTRERFQPLRDITTANGFGLRNPTLKRDTKKFMDIIDKAWKEMQEKIALEAENGRFPYLGNFSPS